MQFDLAHRLRTAATSGDPIYPAAATATVILLITLVVTGVQDRRALPDFDVISDTNARKQAFFSYLAPLVQAENDRIRKQRARLLELADELASGRAPGWLDRRWLRRLADKYQASWHGDNFLKTVERLLIRVDIVPVDLALVQAATESAWGRSRFAVRGNNLFGQRCFEPGCGLVPARRDRGRSHEVAAFNSVRESVARYIHNLNSHPAYHKLRMARAELRRAGVQPDAMALANELTSYSERREDYSNQIKTVIRSNRELIEQALQ